MKPLVIFGAWNFSRVIAETAEAIGITVAGFVDPNPPDGVSCLTSLPKDCDVFVSVADNHLRQQLTQQLAENGRQPISLVHPTAFVSPSAKIGNGCFLGEHSVVRTHTEIADGVFVQAGAIISHDSLVGSFATFGPNATTASKVKVGARTLVGVGGTIAPGTEIGRDCVVAAGAAVFRGAGDNKTHLGNPAKATRVAEKEVIQSNWGANEVW